MKIYIAGPFSKDNERESLNRMITLVKKNYPNAELYIPMEFKVEGDFKNEDGTWNLPNEVWGKKVYESDIKHLNEADMVFGLYIGHYCSSGTVWELGYAAGRGIETVIYIPDWARKEDMSLMLLNGSPWRLEEDGTIAQMTPNFKSQFNQK